MSTDVPAGGKDDPPGKLTLRVAAYVLACDGKVMHADLLAFLRPLVPNPDGMRRGKESRLARWTRQATVPLRKDGAIVRIGDCWYAPRLADLAAWLADGHEHREDAGMAYDPELPGDAAAAA
jgi:hypothetical protein